MMASSPMPPEIRDALIRDLHSAIADMDVPPARKTAVDQNDLAWLGRNLGFGGHNRDHPRFHDASVLLRRLGVKLVI